MYMHQSCLHIGKSSNQGSIYLHRKQTPRHAYSTSVHIPLEQYDKASNPSFKYRNQTPVYLHSCTIAIKSTVIKSS